MFPSDPRDWRTLGYGRIIISGKGVLGHGSFVLLFNIMVIIILKKKRGRKGSLHKPSGYTEQNYSCGWPFWRIILSSRGKINPDIL